MYAPPMALKRYFYALDHIKSVPLACRKRFSRWEEYDSLQAARFVQKFWPSHHRYSTVSVLLICRCRSLWIAEQEVIFTRAAVKSDQLQWLPNGSELEMASPNPSAKPKSYTSFTRSQDSLPEFSTKPITLKHDDIIVAKLGPGQVISQAAPFKLFVVYIVQTAAEDAVNPSLLSGDRAWSSCHKGFGKDSRQVVAGGDRMVQDAAWGDNRRVLFSCSLDHSPWSFLNGMVPHTSVGRSVERCGRGAGRRAGEEVPSQCFRGHWRSRHRLVS